MIGIFDSGVGGLTVLRHVRRQLPGESILYLADTANVPYGDKPLPVVRRLALALTDHLVQAGAQLVIMASGTSTVAGLEQAQARFPSIPILGTIDGGAETAVGAVSGPIGVLSTNATAQSRAFTRAIGRYDPSRPVCEQGCPRFVPLVESGCAGTPAAFDAAREYLAPLAAAGVEAVVLGCTHFPFLLPALTAASGAVGGAAGFRPVFIDPAEEAVRRAAAALTAAGLRASGEARVEVRFAATGDPDAFRQHASALLGEPVPPVGFLPLYPPAAVAGD